MGFENCEVGYEKRNGIGTPPSGPSCNGIVLYLSAFYCIFILLEYYISDVNFRLKQNHHKQTENGSLNYVTFCDRRHFSSYKSSPKIPLDPTLTLRFTKQV